MFDPALIDGLQQAVALQAIMPPAIERAWVSPLAEEGERIVGSWLTDVEEQFRVWRQKVHRAESALERNATSPWDGDRMVELDALIAAGERHAPRMEEWVDGVRRRALRANKSIALQDASAGIAQRRHVERFTAMYHANIATLRSFNAKLRAHRALFDPRTGAEPGYEPKPWTPNTTTANAMREAIAGVGMRRVGSVAEMMAELHAEDD